MSINIDDDFIQSWHPRYDDTENDEPKYQSLLAIVSLEIAAKHTLSKSTFTEILNWKSARVKGRIRWDEFEKYQKVIASSLSTPDEGKMELLVDLYGFGAPVASTFLQFIYPSSFPIIDRSELDPILWTGKLMIFYQLVRRLHETYTSSFIYRRI